MKREPLSVAWDIDGVLFRWDNAAAEALEHEFGYTGLVREQRVWAELRQQVKPEDWAWLFTPEGSEATLRQDAQYPGVVDTLLALAGHCRLSFITHRPTVAAAATAEWIANLGVPFESLHVIGRNGSDRLPKWAITPEADIYVEDRSDNVRELLYNTVSAHVMVPRREYNRDLWDETFQGNMDVPDDGTANRGSRIEGYFVEDSWEGRLHFYDDLHEVAAFALMLQDGMLL